MWATDVYKLVKNVSELSQGDIILITSGTNGNVTAMGTYSTGNNVPAKDVSISNETITSLGDAQEITLESKNASGNYTLKQATNAYFYAANSSNGNKNYLKIKSDNAIYWSIAINTTSSKATVKDETSDCNGRNNLRYNSSNGIYSCYSSGQDDVYIFKKVSTHTLTYSATNGNITGVDANSAVVASGASLVEGATVTLTATPSAGYEFSSWSVEGTGSTLTNTSTNPTTFTMGSANSTVTANFIASSTPSIGLSTTSVATTTADTDDIITVTYNNIANIDAEVLFYESDGTTPADYSSWLDAEINVDNNLYYVIGENTGVARTAYLKVHEKNEDVYSELITVTQEAIVVDAPTIYPAAGAVTAGSKVTLTQASADEIRYTTDGTAPTKTTGTVYSEPISITTATTIKAIAIKNGVASDVAEAAYTISVTTPVFSPEPSSGSSYIEGMEVILTSASNTIYYNMTTDGSDPADPTSSSTQYTSPIALTNGTVKIRAIAYDSYGNTSSATTRTFRGVAPTTLPFSWKGTSSKGKADLAAKTGVALNLASDYATSNAPYRLKFDGVGKNVTVFTNEQPGIVSFTAKLFNATTTGSKMKVQASVDGNEFTDIEEFTVDGEANETFEFTTSNSFSVNQRVVRLVLSTLDKNVAVGSINIDLPGPANPTTSGEETYLTTSDNMAGWRAFYDKDNSYSVDVNTTVYVADVDPDLVENKITLKAIAGIPANVPVILHTSSSADSYKMTLTKETVSPYSYTDENKLIWTTSAVSEKYRLGFGASGVGFYPYSGTPASGAVILNVSSASGARELTIGIDDDVTGISTMHNSQSIMHNEFYNLAGQRVAQPTKGLYIVNGKKVVVK